MIVLIYMGKAFHREIRPSEFPLASKDMFKESFPFLSSFTLAVLFTGKEMGVDQSKAVIDAS
jgi:hypothetical protein